VGLALGLELLSEGADKLLGVVGHLVGRLFVRQENVHMAAHALMGDSLAPYAPTDGLGRDA
jgi:hypothetical protein